MPIIKLEIDQPTLFAEEGIHKSLEDIELGDPSLTGFVSDNLKKIRVDISFDDNSKASRLQSNSLMSSNYATRVIAGDMRVRLLVIMIKKILHMNGLNSAYHGRLEVLINVGGFSSYSIVLLVQAFFKQFQLN